MYPQSNSARSVRDLSGVWDFRFNANEPWQPIAVPASYNDQSPDPEFRRHYGMAYYRTTFTVPEGARRVLRFDAVTHNAVVRLNGQEIASHRGGFLPFEADITALAQPGETVTLDVEVDNRIGHSSLPVGNEGGTAFFGSDNAGIPAVEAGKARQQAQGINLPNFDFFNYAGITRPVHLCTTPAAYIRDVTVAADMTGTLRYTVDTVGEGSVKVEILDAEDRVVACADGAAGTVQVENARLWQPRPGTPYLYTALVKFGKDEYRQKFGFRSVEVSGHKFLINGAPFYFKGPCKHEDSAFRGRGYDACVTVTDLKLYEWLNANCLRMSHYPYAEEVYDLCDRLGIVVIDETPAVGIGAGAACDPYQTFPLKTYHSAVLRAMIERDKNHPCVVLWSLGNEPDTEHFPESRPEIASVGLTEADGKARDIPVKVGKCTLFANARTMIAGTGRSFMKVVAHAQTGVLLGAQLMCEHATDMIGQLSQAIANGMTARQLLAAMRPHPTFEEALGEALEELVAKLPE